MASSAANVGPVEFNGTNGTKRYAETPLRSEEGPRGSYRFKNKKQKKGQSQEEQLLGTVGSNEEVLLLDVQNLLNEIKLESALSIGVSETAERDGTQKNTLPAHLAEIDVTVKEISSTGDGLAVAEDGNHVFVVPFTAPGDKVTAKVYKHFEKGKYALADLVKVNEPSPHRDDSLVQCPYFATCSGCQFQMLPYDYQLAHKKTIVEKAYKNFSNLPPELLPPIGDTIGSPLQYGYRTKLTPHFDGPPDARRSDGRNGIKRTFKQVPPIGFMKKGTRITIDIEDCPIGTPAVRSGMKRERARVTKEISNYNRGATLLLRETTERLPLEQLPQSVDPDTAVEKKPDGNVYLKTCVTDPNAKTTEYIDQFQFVNPAGAFFQNNNSILRPFTQYIRDHILPKETDSSQKKISHLIDAYSGSGLFTITLSSLFQSSLGIDIAASSIASATHNAALNNLPTSQAKFIAADAAKLFASITTPPDETVVVIDPPRKGCDESFLRQLVAYGPERIVYVSCNVHTQARDVGVLVGGLKGVDGGAGVGVGCYEVESLRGFDFFPQTGHVEGVAVLRRKGGLGRVGGKESDGVGERVQ
ncbi:S-adenosyl-L-methionine-dependent methyltransferase [Delitschia confertaspora ATCC 74209]|uniref:tRNA (uracil(54)-C(5))-methyltransferase n=1 Tax=Delitschia confertaspora ATCC 74209 TaxID=1513339 RepID=A0A9P4MUQ3_9PLEO|nr:S-adenosyl-L-methionine-dependent methyltransferase [Delitschia confertaspora ATCC 74209]